MKHIRHIPVIAEQYLRDQTAKTTAQTLVTFWGTNPTNHHNVSYGPYIHMDMNHDTFMRQSNNSGHSDYNSNEKT